MKTCLIEDGKGYAGEDIEEDHSGHHADRRVDCGHPQAEETTFYMYFVHVQCTVYTHCTVPCCTALHFTDCKVLFILYINERGRFEKSNSYF